MKNAYKAFIARDEISFWVPIVSSAVVIAMSWLNLSSRVDLLTQKIDILLDKQVEINISMYERDQKLEDNYALMQKQWGELSQRVTRIER
jgi:hypothetical protein